MRDGSQGWFALYLLRRRGYGHRSGNDRAGNHFESSDEGDKEMKLEVICLCKYPML